MYLKLNSNVATLFLPYGYFERAKTNLNNIVKSNYSKITVTENMLTKHPV